MNEAERGIAAYKATSEKLKKPRKRKKGTPSADEVAVELSTAGEGNASARTRTPAARTDAAPVNEATANGPPKGGATKAASPSASTARLVAQAEGQGYRKVAKFLLLLGKDEAAKILKHFSKEQVEAISREVASIKRVDNAEARALLQEFGVVGTKRGSGAAGPETARAMLTSAFGEERAQQILHRAVPETRQKPFQFLGDLDSEQILLLLKNETAPAMSIILPYLPPPKASRVLSALTPNLQQEVIRRIARLTKVNPEVIARIEGVLKERIRTQGRVVTEEIDGREALAGILRHMNYGAGEKILDGLASVDPELSENVKERLFTIDLVFKVDDADLQAVLRDYDDQELAVILKGKEAHIQERFFASLSSRRVTTVQEELVSLGKMRKADVDSATKDFVDYLVDLDEQHRITIHWDDDFVD